MKSFKFLAAMAIAVFLTAGCFKATIEDTSGFSFIEKCGNEVVAKTLSSQVSLQLLPVETVNVVPSSEAFSIVDFDNVYTDGAYIIIRSVSKNKTVNKIKNLRVEEKNINARIYMPYKDKYGFIGKMPIDIVYARQIPILDDALFAYCASVDVSMEVLELIDKENSCPYGELKCRFWIVLKENDIPIGEASFINTFIVEKQEILIGGQYEEN